MFIIVFNAWLRPLRKAFGWLDSLPAGCLGWKKLGAQTSLYKYLGLFETWHHFQKVQEILALRCTTWRWLDGGHKVNLWGLPSRFCAVTHTNSSIARTTTEDEICFLFKSEVLITMAALKDYSNNPDLIPDTHSLLALDQRNKNFDLGYSSHLRAMHYRGSNSCKRYLTSSTGSICLMNSARGISPSLVSLI